MAEIKPVTVAVIDNFATEEAGKKDRNGNLLFTHGEGVQAVLKDSAKQRCREASKGDENLFKKCAENITVEPVDIYDYTDLYPDEIKIADALHSTMKGLTAKEQAPDITNLSIFRPIFYRRINQLISRGSITPDNLSEHKDLILSKLADLGGSIENDYELYNRLQEKTPGKDIVSAANCDYYYGKGVFNLRGFNERAVTVGGHKPGRPEETHSVSVENSNIDRLAPFEHYGQVVPTKKGWALDTAPVGQTKRLDGKADVSLDLSDSVGFENMGEVFKLMGNSYAAPEAAGKEAVKLFEERNPGLF